jgi:hypothetical protein
MGGQLNALGTSILGEQFLCTNFTGRVDPTDSVEAVEKRKISYPTGNRTQIPHWSRREPSR